MNWGLNLQIKGMGLAIAPEWIAVMCSVFCYDLAEHTKVLGTAVRGDGHT